MLLALVACGNTQPPVDDPAVTTAPTTTKAPEVPVKPAVTYTPYSALNEIWNTFPSDEKLPALGLDYVTQDAPGVIDITTEDGLSVLKYTCMFPEANVNLVKSAAGIMDMRMPSAFYCSAYQFEDEATVDSMIEPIKNAVLGAHFMCGHPEILVMLKAPGNVIISAFGATDTINKILAAAQEGISGVEVILTQSLMEE
jgi:hypothetical protein